MSRYDDTELARRITAIALEAGGVIMAIYEQDFEIRQKADASPVTEADEAAERLIVARLRALTPAIPVVGEEMVAQGQAPEIGGGPFWLVDPLDGTKEFVGRNGEFTVNIALVRDGRPVLGVVHAPVPGLTFTAAGPGRVTRQQNGGPPEAIACRALPADGAVVLASRSHMTAETEAWLKGVTVARLSRAGSSLKFCRLATGEADLYPRLGRTMEWDTAAAHAVLAAAGGSVETLDGKPLTYGKPGLENPHFIARGRPAE
jgi:3'(2'), 5'-bisphosphate nucleotidase